MKRTLLTATLLLFAALLFFAWHTVEQADAYERTTLELVEALGTQDRVATGIDKVLEAFSLGAYRGYSERLEALKAIKERQGAYRESLLQLTALFYGGVPLLLLCAWLIRRDGGDAAYAMLAVSVVALAVGLMAPILSISASKALPLLGETIFQFESKGVLATIDTLNTTGNRWLAALLLLFSVVIPLAKTLLTGLTFFAGSHHLLRRGVTLAKHIGKWSMADVFVVAILVAFFANHDHGLTDAEVQVGLWFFAGYVVLSLIATQLISRRLERGEA